MMVCRLVTLENPPRMRPVRIEKTLRRDLARLVLRVEGDKTKVTCKNLKLCEIIEVGIKEATTVVQMSWEERSTAIGNRRQGEIGQSERPRKEG